MTFHRDEDLKGSEIRLWRLIESRAEPGADVARIDRRIWDLFGTESAIMFTDLSGFSRHVAAFGVVDFLQIIFQQKQLLLPIVEAHDGVLIKVEADSFLIVFKRAASALTCAIAMQQACQRHNKDRAPQSRILLCVGIGYGSILRIGDIDVFGAEVNAASKLGEDTARANEILVTEAARDAAGTIEGVSYVDRELAVPGSDRNYRAIYPIGE